MSQLERIEDFLEGLGKFFAWILLALMASIILQVGLNLMSSSITWMEELQWYLYGISAMVAVPYTMTGNGHVRVDVFYSNFSVRRKQILETLWIMVALVPLFVLTSIYGCEFAIDAFIRNERSPDSGGMPYRWVVKAFIPLSSLLLIVTACLRMVLIWLKPELFEDNTIIHGN